MPDAPISTTPSLGLGKYAEGANPGAEALNAHWDTLDAFSLPHATEFPETFGVGGLFLKDDTKAIYRNDGSEEVPSWTRILSVQDAVDEAEAYTDTQIGIEASVRAAADTTLTTGLSDEEDARIAEDLTFLKKDGSRAMTGALDMDSHKIVNLTNGSDPSDAVNKGQLDAAIAAGLGGLGTDLYCRAHNSANLGSGTSPRTFEADTEDSDTGAMHDTGSNPDRFTAPVDGYYRFSARLKVAGFNGCGIQWFKNGTAAPEGDQPKFVEPTGEGADGPITFLGDEIVIQLDAGDYVTVKIYGMTEPDAGYIMASSYVDSILLSANAPGGGDLRSDGTVPMTAPFDNGGEKTINMADGEDPTDGATVGQVESLVDDAIADLDLSSIADAVLATLPPVQTWAYATRKSGNVQADSLSPAAIPDMSVSPEIKDGSTFRVKFNGIYNSRTFGHPRITLTVRIDGVTVWAGEFMRYQVGAGDDFFHRIPISIDLPFTMTELGLSEGEHTIALYHHNETGHKAELFANGTTWPALIVEYVAA